MGGCALAAEQAAPTAVEFVSPTSQPATAAQETADSPTPTAAATQIEATTERLPSPGVQLAEQPASSGYLVPLTTRHLTSTTASFSFELESPQNGYLLYRPDLPGVEGWFSAALDPTRTQQQLTLSDLLPGRSYLVQVGLGDDRSDLRPAGYRGLAWGPLEVRTPAQGTVALRVGVIGDTGFDDPVTAQLVDRMGRQQLDFVLHTGDVVYNAHEQEDPIEAWAVKFYWPFAPLLSAGPVYPVPGNHEYDQATFWQGQPFYFRAFPAVGDSIPTQPGLDHRYSFSYAGIQFLMLDSQLYHGVAGRSEQTTWLRERLLDPTFRFTMAVFHTPPFTSGRHLTDGAALRAEWTPLFESAQVPLVLSGHDHNYERIQFNGVTYLVSGGGSRVLYPFTSQVGGSQFFARQSHFVLLEIGSEAIAITAINVNGEILDQVEISTPP